MNDRFELLDEEKRQRILNAAMAEFSANGYDHASTNAIVEQAGIAKGLLFHYFKSKKKLFVYLYNYCIDIVLNEVYASDAMQETDFFVKMRKGSRAKLSLLQKYPQMFKFTGAAYVDESHEIRPELEQRNRELIDAASRQFLGNIDQSKFRPGLDIPRAINVMMWSLEGMTNQYLLRLKLTGAEFSVDEAVQESERYLQMFQELFYR